MQAPSLLDGSEGRKHESKPIKKQHCLSMEMRLPLLLTGLYHDCVHINMLNLFTSIIEVAIAYVGVFFSHKVIILCFIKDALVQNYLIKLCIIDS